MIDQSSCQIIKTQPNWLFHVVISFECGLTFILCGSSNNQMTNSNVGPPILVIPPFLITLNKIHFKMHIKKNLFSKKFLFAFIFSSKIEFWEMDVSKSYSSTIYSKEHHSFYKGYCNWGMNFYNCRSLMVDWLASAIHWRMIDKYCFRTSFTWSGSNGFLKIRSKIVAPIKTSIIMS